MEVEDRMNFKELFIKNSDYTWLTKGLFLAGCTLLIVGTFLFLVLIPKFSPPLAVGIMILWGIVLGTAALLIYKIVEELF